MWFVVSKKKHQAVLDEWGHEEHNWHEIFSEQDAKIDEQAAILKSSEREQVLTDLETSLKLIQQYQRSLSMISASDPNITAANRLLKKYGLKGDPNATYLGATSHPLKSKWQEEEERWGDEAYGSGTVRIEAEAIDEGENKEPGYTRGRIQYTDLDAEDPPILAAAKATTEEASG